MSKNADWWWKKGLEHEKGQEWDEALDCYGKATELDPHNPEPWNSMGWVWWAARADPDNALRCFCRAIRERRGCAMSWVNKGVVLKNLGRLDEALECYQQAVSIPGALKVDAQRAWYNMGVLYLQLLQQRDDPSCKTEAGRCADKALEIDPNYVLAQRLRDAIRQLNC